MVALLNRNELVFLGRTLGVVVVADEADGAVDGV
jgi:seryl-tRNA(Sec) selenium transferase